VAPDVSGTRGRARADEIATEKQAVRERVWTLLQRRGAARFPGAQGRIPNFTGAEGAADGLAGLPEWRSAEVAKANPDAPQLPVRARALQDRKLLYMAVPRLRDPKPFIRIDPDALEVPPRRAASISGANAHGRPAAVGHMRRIDLVVCGSVGVNRMGQRVGKGGGFSDLEFALLTEAGLIDDRTAIATTVHDLQVLDEELPETRHDFRVDLIVTPTGTIRPKARKRPPGIIWSHLGEDKIEEIPVLAAMSRRRSR
jgi:5-formyltetrahydrofolate cyclo-ligase